MTEILLLSTDLSSAARHLVPYAVKLSALMHAPLHVVHVVPRIDNYSTVYMPGTSITKMESVLRGKAQKTMEAFCSVWFDKIRRLHAAVLFGDIAQELIRYIEKEAISLVVMGTHARAGVKRLIHGSVSDQVTRGCRVPVLLFNPYQPSPSHHREDPYSRPSQCPILS